MRLARCSKDNPKYDGSFITLVAFANHLSINTFDGETAISEQLSFSIQGAIPRQ